MPLSKARDKERKKKGRAKTRLDKAISPPQTSKPVLPKDWFHRDVIGIVETPYSRLSPLPKPDIDADGNEIPDYE